MARPREFDIDEALDNAMAVFWRKGYDGTSLPDLLDAMQIARGSFYKAFADKRSVYLACLDRYDRAVISEAVARLTDTGRGDGRSRIAAFFNAVAAGGRTDRRGCFLCNAATERAPFDAAVEAKVAAMTERLRAALAIAAQQASALEGAAAQRIDAIAGALATFYSGLQIQARAGMPEKSLRATISAALALVPEA